MGALAYSILQVCAFVCLFGVLDREYIIFTPDSRINLLYLVGGGLASKCVSLCVYFIDVRSR